ncbi:hypothetical protein [Cetobacterium sp.]|uniref:hypothetical protein n=1 Tax=Cetobacterium sp. TaxID=2071632 RepID=UPI003EE598E3
MGGAASWVAQKVSNAVDWVADKIGGAVDWIRDKISSIGDTPSYNPETATTDQTKMVNELIQKCVDEYGAQAKEFENTAKNILKNYMEKIDESLEIFKRDNIVPEYIFINLSHETKMLSKNIENMYIEGINKVFSLNNNALLDILKLEAGEKKQKKLQALAIKTLENTHTIFGESIKLFLEEQQNSLIKELKLLKEEKRKEGENVEKKFEELRKKIEQEMDLTSEINHFQDMIKKLEYI